MDDTEVTIASIKAELAADKGFSRPGEQCAVYARNFRHDNFSLDEYRALKRRLRRHRSGRVNRPLVI